jgi:hypothetical protein
MTRVMTAGLLLVLMTGAAGAETMRVIKCNEAKTECYYKDVEVRKETEWDRLRELQKMIQDAEGRLRR